MIRWNAYNIMSKPAKRVLGNKPKRNPPDVTTSLQKRAPINGKVREYVPKTYNLNRTCEYKPREYKPKSLVELNKRNVPEYEITKYDHYYEYAPDSNEDISVKPVKGLWHSDTKEQRRNDRVESKKRNSVAPIQANRAESKNTEGEKESKVNRKSIEMFTVLRRPQMEKGYIPHDW